MAIEMEPARTSRRGVRGRRVSSVQPWAARHEAELVSDDRPTAATAELRVLVHGDSRFLGDGVALLLDAEPTLHVVGRTRRCAELVGACARNTPDVVVLHVDLLDLDLISAVADLRDRFATMRVVAVGGRVHAEQWKLARGLGIDDVVSSSAGAAALVAAVVGDSAAPASAAEPLQRLTHREHGILELVGHGLKAREISTELGITTKTVENHKQKIFAKLGVQNQAHAVSIAVRSGLLRTMPELRAVGDG